MAATATAMVQKLRDAQAELANAFNVQYKDSIFDGLIFRKEAPEGYAKFWSMTRRAAFEKLEDEMKPVGLDARSYEIATEVHKAGYEIDRKTLDNAKAIASEPEIMAVIKDLAGDSIAHEDQYLTDLLEDNGNDIFGSSFFASGASIWNSPAAATITNTSSGSGATAANIKSAYYDFLEIISTQLNSAARLMHGPGALKKKPVCMIPSALLDAAEDVFEVDTTANGGTNKTYKRAEVKVNPLLADQNDFYFFVPGAGPMSALLLAYEKKPELESDARGGENASRDTILRDTYLFGARYAFQVGYGNRTSIVRITNS